jgi:myosin heavy subunit
MMGKFLVAKNLGNRSVVLVPYNINQACAARDAMIKKVYGDLFQAIVDKINTQLSASSAKRHKFIGVLDIFGFESFTVNSFEQLCINYCNEKLQFHFNEHIFKMEQTLYASEGIVIPGSSFVDNQPTLDLLELKGTGVFSMCDE